MSNSSGTAFPVTNLVVGMNCFRADLNKEFQLVDFTPTWIMTRDFAKTVVDKEYVDNQDGNKVNTSDVVTIPTASKVLKMDINGKLPADVTGNSATATKLATARNINGVAFDGTADITIGGIPVGTYIESACASAPSGYLACDGALISRTTYSALFTAIGVLFGAGDGSTTFKLPDRRDRLALANGTTYATLGATGGEINHTLTTAEMPSHNHNGFVAYGGDSGAGASSGGGAFVASGTTSATGGGLAHNNMPPYIVVNIYIKY